MGLLEPRLGGLGFTKDEVEDLSYALGEILADLEGIMPVLLARQVPSRDDVLELIWHAVSHWPGHQREIAKLERKMPLSASTMLSKRRRKERGLQPHPPLGRLRRKPAKATPKARSGRTARTVRRK